MDMDLMKKIRKKEDKDEVDWTVLRYHKALMLIDAILVDESKFHVSGEEAIERIRECMRENFQ